jgi:hypothetical protein
LRDKISRAEAENTTAEKCNETTNHGRMSYGSVTLFLQGGPRRRWGQK